MQHGEECALPLEEKLWKAEQNGGKREKSFDTLS